LAKKKVPCEREEKEVRKMIKIPKTDNVQELVPEGLFEVKLIKAEERTGKETGKDYVSLEFEIVGDKYQGYKVFDSIGSEEASLWRWKGLKLAYGLPDEEEFDVETLYGECCMVNLIREVYEGQASPKIQRYKKLKK